MLPKNKAIQIMVDPGDMAKIGKLPSPTRIQLVKRLTLFPKL
jgi:hypothetical protein